MGHKHFASWLGLAPHNDTAGGGVLRSRLLPTRNRAGQAFRQAATSLARSPRKPVQGDPLFAQVATAHKLARIVYHLLKYHVQYIDIGADGFAFQQRARELAALRKRATKLGLKPIVPEGQLAFRLTPLAHLESFSESEGEPTFPPSHNSQDELGIMICLVR